MNDLTNPKNTVGRPREHDRKEIAEKLVTWAKLDNSLNLCAFCCLNEIPPSRLAVWARECNQFCIAYELSKSFIAVRREQKLSSGELHVKAYDLNASTYDYFLKEEKREEKSFDAELKKGILNSSLDILVETITYANHLKDKSIVRETEVKTNPTA